MNKRDIEMKSRFLIPLIVALLITSCGTIDSSSFSSSSFSSSSSSRSSSASSSQHVHTKGEFLELVTSSIQGVTNPGKFKCLDCGKDYYDTVTYQEVGLPIISLTGSFSGISQDNKKNIVIGYEDDDQNFSLNSTIKLQGGVSLQYAKKNYNIQFFENNSFESKKQIKFVDNWGSHSKYTLKANWVDYSQMRNVVTAKIYGDIVHSREIIDDYTSPFNGGAVDGFPIVVYQNGSFQGLYTLNTAKDEYIFDMNGDDTTRQAIIMGGAIGPNWQPTVALKAEMNGNYNDGWEFEYASTQDNPSIGTGWVKTSFNNFIRFLNNSSDNDFKANVNNYTSIDRTIDSMLLTWLSRANDNTAKNILWSTFDGTHWVPSVYDLDGTWGLKWDGTLSFGSEVWIPWVNDQTWERGNKLWERIYKNFYANIVSRYAELREGPLSFGNIDKRFTDFRNSIPSYLYECDSKVWPGVPTQTANHVTQMLNWAKDTLANFDSLFNYQTTENTPYNIEFETVNNVSIKVYFSNDYTQKGDLTTKTLSRDGDSGYISKEGSQVNFQVSLPNGYQVDKIDINGTYSEIKNPEETGVNNLYKVTNIASDLDIIVAIKAL